MQLQIEILVAMLCLLGTVKKKSVFGQLTLTGVKALDWLKSSQATEKGGFTTAVLREIWFCCPKWLMEQTYAVPDWGLEKPMVLVMFERHTGRAILVHQKSAMEAVETLCVAWEENGMEVKSEAKGKKHRLTFKDDMEVSMNFQRGTGEFARYEVAVV